MLQNYILIIEDSDRERELYAKVLISEGHNVLTSATLQAARELIKQKPVGVIICDVNLPDGNGLEFIKEIKQTHPSIQIIMFTGMGSIADGVKAIKNGGFDYIVKGESPVRLLMLVEQAFNYVEQAPIKKLEHDTNMPTFDAILGSSKALIAAKSFAQKISKTELNVLLTGETGTGKDRFAEAIHASSMRSSGPFIAINCSAISPELLESELFGYKAGAFSGALKDKKGLFEAANNGTIFLDEIGEMSINLQAKILRVLENKSFLKIGDTKTYKTNCRLISATHINLQSAIASGQFREDLYYRISAITVEIPPLRERSTDVEIIARHYIPILCEQLGIAVPEIHKDFLAKLSKHDWPGNVRELINVLQRALIRAEGVLDGDSVDVSSFKAKASKNGNLDSIQKEHIKSVLEQSFGNKRLAARRLGISIATLYRKLE